MATQRILNKDQVAAFYHSEFVSGQIRHFKKIVPPVAEGATIVDVGGGCGYFALALRNELSAKVRVIDIDPQSVANCLQLGLDAQCQDALTRNARGDERVICFNLILHHLVGPSDKETEQLQARALANWDIPGVQIFINEYIYDSWFADASGRLIYAITSSAHLSAIARAIAKFLPTLRANTFGIGVRFRSRRAWIRLFEENGFRVIDEAQGNSEKISLPRRALLIRSIRRDSFLLEGTARNDAHRTTC